MQAAPCSIASLLVFAVASALYADQVHADQLVYVTLPQPCRLLDTRLSSNGLGPLTATHGSYLLGTSTGDISGSFQNGNSAGCGIPAGIEAVSVSMNMLGATGSGNISTWNADSGTTAPNIGTGVYNPQVNYNTGYSTIPVGAPNTPSFAANPNAGKFYLQVANGQIDMTINVVGYWLPISWNQFRGIPGPGVALGFNTTASGYVSTAIGGATTASGEFSTAMGDQTTATGNDSTAMGGHTTASGSDSTAMGYDTTASGDFSTAMGEWASTTDPNNSTYHYGSFVYGDGSQPTNSTANQQFMVRASGGFVFYSSYTNTSGVQLAPGAGGWTSLSDRNAKDAIHPVDAREVLARVITMPVSTWHYKTQDEKYRHMGPMAQDFRAAFGLGETDKGIDDIDAQGVALAAIQGLHAQLQDKEAEIAALRDDKNREVAALRDDNASLRARVASLESVARDVAEMKAQLATLRHTSPPTVVVATAMQP